MIKDSLGEEKETEATLDTDGYEQCRERQEDRDSAFVF